MKEATQLTWTTDKPKEEGFYWLKQFLPHVNDAVLTRVTMRRDKLAVQRLSLKTYGAQRIWDMSEIDGEWYGPLEIPS